MFETLPFDLVTFVSVLVALFTAFLSSMLYRWLIVEVWAPWMETSKFEARCPCGFESRRPREMMSHVIGVHPGFDGETRVKIFSQYNPGAAVKREEK